MKTDLIEDILVLYVEDDENIRTEVEYFLNKRFKNVKVAFDGQMGYEAYLEHKPDIIITDIRMPNVDGIKMSKKIRLIDNKTPIIITSAYTDSEYLDEAISIGINTFLLKPISLMQLYCTLKITYENILLQRKNKKTKSELDDTRQLLVEADKMANLGNLVAGATHELNTPLGVGFTSISHLIDTTTNLKENYKKDTMTQEMFEEYLDSAQELLKMVDFNLHRASCLVQTFKKVAVDQASEEKREFDLKDYIEEIIFSLKYVLKKTNIEVKVTCKDLILINSYPGDFSQIITNFVMNSKKHAFDEGEKGLISIDIKKEEKNILLTYSDNGKGIAKDKLEKIFDKFYTTKRGQGGSGLGLNIVKDIVISKLHGTIKCESTQNEGTTFILTIPFK